MAEKKELTGPDLARGISLSKLADGTMLQGHAKKKPILVARRGDGYFAIGAMCTHYVAPLATGIIVDDTVRCPWHHACFSLRTGEALRAPALDPVTCWKVETRAGKLFVRDKALEKKPRAAGSAKMPENVVVVGGGAAGNAAAEMLRREGYRGDLTLLSADDSIPYSRRAQGGSRTSRPDRGVQYSGPARALRCGAVLLDEPIRFYPQYI